LKKKRRTTVIDNDVLYSKAYWTLKVHGIRVLTTFYMKRRMKEHNHNKRSAWWEITNNGELVFTYKEAVNKWHMSRKQFAYALDDLIAKGFLEITYQGTGPGDPSTYKLIERWQAYGTDHFKPAPERRKNVSKKMGWDLYNKRKEVAKK
jgi:hypothetical protein